MVAKERNSIGYRSVKHCIKNFQHELKESEKSEEMKLFAPDKIHILFFNFKI
jgi:hypothetical protein